MRTLVKIGYQRTYAVLQARHYRVPETNMTTGNMVTEPRKTLLLFLEPKHVSSDMSALFPSALAKTLEFETLSDVIIKCGTETFKAL